MYVCACGIYLEDLPLWNGMKTAKSLKVPVVESCPKSVQASPMSPSAYLRLTPILIEWVAFGTRVRFGSRGMWGPFRRRLSGPMICILVNWSILGCVYIIIYRITCIYIILYIIKYIYISVLCIIIYDIICILIYIYIYCIYIYTYIYVNLCIQQWCMLFYYGYFCCTRFSWILCISHVLHPLRFWRISPALRPLLLLGEDPGIAGHSWNPVIQSSRDWWENLREKYGKMLFAPPNLCVSTQWIGGKND